MFFLNNIGFEDEVRRVHFSIKEEIEKRLSEFRAIWKEGTEEDIFGELAFCLFTPQSKARCCWEAVSVLKEDGRLFVGKAEEMVGDMRKVRFLNKKSRYLVKAREQFSDNGSISIKKRLEVFCDEFSIRNWLCAEVSGLGMKEASHFMRNIGKGENLAILDRHVLKNLHKTGAIEEVPASVNSRLYLQIEKKMHSYSKETGIPVAHIDFVFWYMEAGEVFK